MWLMGAVVLLGLGVRAWAAPATLDRVEIHAERGAVTLHFSTPVQARAAALGPEGEAPDRVYVDVAGVTIGRGTPTVVPGIGNVLRVRTGQFDARTTRVVLDLAHAAPFALRVAGTSITIELGPGHLAPPRTFAHRREPPDAVASAASPPQTSAAAPHVPSEPQGPPAPAPRREPPPLAKPQPPRATPAPPALAARPEPPPAAAEPGPPPVPSDGPPPPAAERREPPPARAAKPAPKPPAVAKGPAPIFPVPVIVLDAGHGGRDPGAEGIGGVQEKDIALVVTQRLAARLPTRIPAIVVLTRTDDSFVSIDRRLAASTDTASAFVSLHANASSDPSLHGVEVFYGGGDIHTVGGTGASPRAASLGSHLGDALRPRVELLRRPRPGDFGVLVRNRVPSALVEIGYLTHPGDALRAQDPVYHDLLADALAEGIAAFLRASAARL
jgi:N-acetylmuramoyl-L-alanine amidase